MAVYWSMTAEGNKNQRNNRSIAPRINSIVSNPSGHRGSIHRPHQDGAPHLTGHTHLEQ